MSATLGLAVHAQNRLTIDVWSSARRRRADQNFLYLGFKDSESANVRDRRILAVHSQKRFPIDVWFSARRGRADQNSHYLGFEDSESANVRATRTCCP